MQITTFLLLLALLTVVAWFVTRPLMRQGHARILADDHEVSSLLAERERVLEALEELDFDYALGKVPADEYPLQRSALLKQGAAILRRLDTLSSSPEQKMEMPQPVPAEQPDAMSDDEIETLIAARRSARKARSGGFCPACGKPIMASDRFCPYCGKTLR
jgi:NADH pyrophosphatase NudC (nudix superfamily)